MDAAVVAYVVVVGLHCCSYRGEPLMESVMLLSVSLLLPCGRVVHVVQVNVRCAPCYRRCAHVCCVLPTAARCAPWVPQNALQVVRLVQL